MILSDTSIVELRTSEKLKIEPFVDSKIVCPTSGLSYGLSHAGYDVRLKSILPKSRFNDYTSKKIKAKHIKDLYGSTDMQKILYKEKIYANTVSKMWMDPINNYILGPKEFCLGVIEEFLSFPDNVCGLLRDKSSLARMGIQVQNTVAEPGWCGYLTIELVNHSHVPIILFSGMPIAQMQFQLLDKPCQSAYSGKYQNQANVPVPSIVR